MGRQNASKVASPSSPLRTRDGGQSQVRAAAVAGEGNTDLQLQMEEMDFLMQVQTPQT